MPARHLTAPSDELLRLIAKRSGLRVWPTVRDAYVSAMLALLNTVAKIRAELSAIERNCQTGLTLSGVTAKSCRDCGEWFQTNVDGRPRLCCPSCKPVRSSRSGIVLSPADADSGLAAVS